MKLIKFIITLPLLCFGLAFGQIKSLDNLIQPGAKLEKLADGFLFTEGPTSDQKGNVYFTDQPNDRIMLWSVSGNLSTFMQPCGHSNGMSFDKEGNLWTCADEKNELWSISTDKKITVIPSNTRTNPLTGQMIFGILRMEVYILQILIINGPGGIMTLCLRIARRFTILHLIIKQSPG